MSINIVPFKETFCTNCHSSIKDFIQNFFDKDDKIIYYDCFMKQNPDIEYDNQLANTLFKMGNSIEQIGSMISKIKIKK